MTRDDIIKIAQKITGVSFPLGIDGISIGMNEKHLQDFANVIAAAERDRLILAAERCIVCEQRRICHETSKKNALG